MVEMHIELTNLKGNVLARHMTEESYTVILEQEWKEPIRIKVTTPRETEEFEVLPF